MGLSGLHESRPAPSRKAHNEAAACRLGRVNLTGSCRRRAGDSPGLRPARTNAALTDLVFKNHFRLLKRFSPLFLDRKVSQHGK